MPGQAKRHIDLGRRVALALFTWLVLPAFVWGQATIEIKVHSTATVDSDTIALGDVAEIEPDHHQRKQELCGIKIGPAPMAGQSRWIHPAEIKLRLTQSGLHEASYRLTSAGPVKVLRSHAAIGPQKINAAVKDFIMHHAPWNSDQLKIENLTFDTELKVPSGAVAFKVSAPKHTDWLGPIPFSVAVLVDGQPVKRVTALATIEVWSDVVMTVKPLGKYQPIGADDIRTEKANLARVPSGAVLDISQVLGSRTNRHIAANCVLRRDQVEMPPVVKRGDVVQVIAESPILRVQTKAMAKENGAIGERIRVMNLRSKKTIYAQVVDAQTVTVGF